jgi:hypothetical protein
MSDDFPAFTPQHFSALAATIAGDRPPSPSASPFSSRASRDGESFVNVSPVVAVDFFSGGVRPPSSTMMLEDPSDLDNITGRLSSLSRSLMAVDVDPESGILSGDSQDYALRKPVPSRLSEPYPPRSSLSPPPTFDALPQKTRLLELLAKKPPRVGACQLFRFDGNPSSICGGRVGKDESGMCIKAPHLCKAKTHITKKAWEGFDAAKDS